MIGIIPQALRITPFQAVCYESQRKPGNDQSCDLRFRESPVCFSQIAHESAPSGITRHKGARLPVGVRQPRPTSTRAQFIRAAVQRGEDAFDVGPHEPGQVRKCRIAPVRIVQRAVVNPMLQSCLRVPPRHASVTRGPLSCVRNAESRVSVQSRRGERSWTRRSSSKSRTSKTSSLKA